MTVFIENLTIIGVGLIGGSLARALRAAGACGRVTGVGRSENTLKRARELGIIDDYQLRPSAAVGKADVVVLATPLTTMDKLMSEIQAALPAAATVTDVGSAKSSVIAAATRSLGDRTGNFVPGHPIAGRECSGVDAAQSDLFQDHLVILTPTAVTEPAHVEIVTGMWQTTGARVVTMAADHHDRVLAATSHLPHMLAYSLVDCLAQLNEIEEIFRYAAGGFADFTRIASSSPEMWRDICLANREELERALDILMRHLSGIKTFIHEGDANELYQVFARAKQSRDRFLKNSGHEP